jgi:hypothetical protein
MNVTKPSDMSNGVAKLAEAISRFEQELKTEDKDENYYHLVITGEYSEAVCDQVERKYVSAGWSNAVCSTSSKKGERSGLTGLQLWAQ